MTFVAKLQTALGVVFLLTTAGAIGVTAQTPAVVDSTSSNSRNKATTTAAPTGEPQKSGFAEPSTAPAANFGLEKTVAISRRPVNNHSFAFAPAALAKTATFAGPEPPPTPQAVDADNWHFQVTPYFWLVGLHGNAGVGNRTAGVDMNFGRVFETLNFFAMGTFEARKGRFFSLTDVEYASISDENATPGPFFSTVDAGFKMFIFDQEVGYRLYETDNGGSVDVLGGVRVWHLSTDFEFGAGILPAARIDGSRTWVDGVGGLRGKAPLSDKVFVTGKFDLGGGGSEFTWQVFGGLGYNIRPNIALIGGYRVLDVNYNKNNFVYDMNERGPIGGVAFRF